MCYTDFFVTKAAYMDHLQFFFPLIMPFCLGYVIYVKEGIVSGADLQVLWTLQLLFVALITMSVFFRTTMHHDTIDDGGLYLGSLYFSMVIILFNGFTEVSMLVAKLPVLYKHRDLHFYPSWVYTLPSWVLSIPTSLIESGLWVAVTYYVIGYDPAITR
jgi:hypothetical protein